MPRRKQAPVGGARGGAGAPAVANKRRNAQAKPEPGPQGWDDAAMVRRYAVGGEPPPSKAEIQAEWERVLGFQPGELDADKCARRDHAHRARMSRYLDAVYGKENQK